MQWTQHRFENGEYGKLTRFKCNRCGTTTSSTDEEHGPAEWAVGPSPGWHVCPSCQQGPRRRTALLPVVN